MIGYSTPPVSMEVADDNANRSVRLRSGRSHGGGRAAARLWVSLRFLPKAIGERVHRFDAVPRGTSRVDHSRRRQPSSSRGSATRGSRQFPRPSRSTTRWMARSPSSRGCGVVDRTRHWVKRDVQTSVEAARGTRCLPWRVVRPLSCACMKRQIQTYLSRSTIQRSIFRCQSPHEPQLPPPLRLQPPKRVPVRYSRAAARQFRGGVDCGRGSAGRGDSHRPVVVRCPQS